MATMDSPSSTTSHAELGRFYNDTNRSYYTNDVLIPKRLGTTLFIGFILFTVLQC